MSASRHYLFNLKLRKPPAFRRLSKLPAIGLGFVGDTARVLLCSKFIPKCLAVIEEELIANRGFFMMEYYNNNTLFHYATLKYVLNLSQPFL